MNRVYVSGVGQHDNIGDTVLRRGLIDAVRPGVDLHVLVGGLSDEYCAGLELASTDTLYRSTKAWHRSMLRSALSRRTWLVFSAGEAIADLHSVPERVLLFVEGVLLRLRRGGSVQTGVGIRKPIGRYRFPLVASLRPARLVTWRDQWSRDEVGFGTVTPDWGFAEGSVIEEWAARADRGFIAVTLRHDRPYPSAVWFDSLRTVSAESGLKLWVITQVSSDTERSRRLADDLGADLLEWQTDDLQVQEEVVRAAYAKCRAIVSDRVHALIIGQTEGAVPIAYSPQVPEKAKRTLEAGGVVDIAFAETEQDEAATVERLHALLGRDDEMRDRLADARATLARLTTSLQALLGRPAARP